MARCLEEFSGVGPAPPPVVSRVFCPPLAGMAMRTKYPRLDPFRIFRLEEFSGVGPAPPPVVFRVFCPPLAGVVRRKPDRGWTLPLREPNHRHTKHRFYAVPSKHGRPGHDAPRATRP